MLDEGMGEDRFGLKEKYLKMIIDVFKKYKKVEKAFIYGSRVKNSYKPGSDIDIAVVGQELDFSEYLKILDELEQLDIPNKIDLVKFELLDEGIKEDIRKYGEMIYKK